MRREKKARKWISLWLSFLIALLMTAVLCPFFIYYGVFHSSATLEQVGSSGYYEESYRYFSDAAEKISSQAGLPDSFVEEAFPYQKFYVQARAWLEKGEKVNRQETEKKADQWIREWLNRERMDAETDQQIQELAETVTEQYAGVVEQPWITVREEYREKWDMRMYLYAGIGIAVLIGFSVALVCLYHHKYRGLRYLVYASMGSAMLSSVFLMGYTRFIQSYGAECEPAYYGKLLEGYFRQGAELGKIAVIASFLTGCVIFGLICGLRNGRRGYKR